MTVPRALPASLLLVLMLASGGPGLAQEPAPSPAAGQTATGTPPTTGAPAATAAPTTTGRILGRVTDAGKPVSGAQVRLVSRSESGLLRVTSSNERGEYRFKELPTGTYDVEVEAEGFRPGAKPGVEVKAPFQNIVDVPMARGATGSQAPAPGAPPVVGVPGQGIPGRGAEPGQNASEPAPEPAPVRGLLSDRDRHPVVDVSVLLVALQGTRVYQAISGPDGAFVIDRVVPGRYRALVRSPGHMPVDLKSVEVKPAAGLTLNLSLVDFPLNFKTRADGSPPPEVPRPLPGAPAAPPSETAPAPPPASTPPAAPPPNPAPPPSR